MGQDEMETYIYRRHNMVMEYIATRTGLDLSLKVERRRVLWVPKRWWEQEGLDFGGLQEAGTGRYGEGER